MSVTSIKIGSKPSISGDYSGQGEMVLFLHGIGGNKNNWKNNINFFSKNFLTVAWDTRGYGDSDDYNGELDFNDVLDDLKKVIDFFNKNKAHIVGLSMGGQIATLFYDKYPNYVKTLTLCDTHFGLSNLSPNEIEKFINLKLGIKTIPVNIKLCLVGLNVKVFVKISISQIIKIKENNRIYHPPEAPPPPKLPPPPNPPKPPPPPELPPPKPPPKLPGKGKNPPE